MHMLQMVISERKIISVRPFSQRWRDIYR